MNSASSHPSPFLARFTQTAQRIHDIMARRIERIDQELELAKLSLNPPTVQASPLLAQAVCMAHHPRLGSSPGCHLQSMPEDILQMVVTLAAENKPSI